MASESSQEKQVDKASSGSSGVSPAHAEHADSKDFPGFLPKKREITQDECYDQLGFCYPVWKKWTVISVIFIVQVSMNINTVSRPDLLRAHATWN